MHKKGLMGAAKIGILFAVITLVAVTFAIYVSPALANTHTSTVDVTPHIVPAAVSASFTAHVEWISGPDPIHEFRVYEPLEFDDLDCDPATDWYDPQYGYTTIEEVEYYYCQWNAKPGKQLDAGNPEKDFTFSLNTAETECCRYLFVETRDDNGYYDFHNPQVCVDTSPPITTKSFDGPQKKDPETGVEWIDGETYVVLNPIDPQPHPSGVDKTWYANYLSEDEDPCWHPEEFCYVPEYIENCIKDKSECVFEWQEYCKKNWEKEKYSSWQECAEDYAHGECGVEEEWHIYTEPFQKEEESCHILYYLSIDNVGKVEDVNVNCFFVDKKAPIGEKTVGDPKIPCSEDESITGEDLTLILENKDSSTWEIKDGDGIKATLKYNDMGPEFEYELTANGLKLDTDYSLIYYADFDPRFEIWGGNNPGALITTATTDGSGNIATVSGSTNLGMNLPSEPDWNINPSPDYCDKNNGFDNYVHCSGAKIWLVPSSYYDKNKKKVTAWKPNEFLFETDLINYTFAECYWVRDPSSLEGTEITLDCEDPEPHPSGDEEVCYRVSFDYPDWHYITDQYCSEDLEHIEQVGHEGYWCCVESPETIIFKEDSLHDLEYFCRDAVDKKSEIDLEWFRVDSQPPIITKEMIGDDHLGYNAAGELDPEACPPRPGMGDTCYVRDDGLNGVKITVKDDDTYPECDVGIYFCTYRLLWYASKEECEEAKGPDVKYDNGRCSIYYAQEHEGGGKEIIFKEDSTHDLNIYCKDLLGNDVRDVETFLVDSTPPTTIKTYIPEEYINPETKYEYIDTIHEVKLTAKDNKVGLDEIRYRVSGDLADRFCENCAGWMQSLRPDMGPWNTYVDPFPIEEESCHVIEYKSIDLLGNEEPIQWQCVFVDKKAPEITKEYKEGDPYYTDGTSEWINKLTTIIISVIDPAPHPSGVAETKYRYDIVNDDYCDGTLICEDAVATTGWITLSDPTYEEFNILDDSCHIIEIISKDNVGKESTHKQCVFVDNKKPEITKTIVGPKSGDCPPRPGTDDICYIDGDTIIEVEAIDPKPHPVGLDKCYWWYYWYEDWEDYYQGGPKSGIRYPSSGSKYTFPIEFIDESVHELYIKCKDLLGNEVEDVELFVVDKTPPETYKRYAGPQYPEEGYSKWITSETEVWLSASDDIGPHDSGVKATYYRDVYLDNPDDWHYCYEDCQSWDPIEPTDPLNPESEGWTLYDGPFFKSPESCHIIEYYSVDNVDKVEDIKWQCVFVDNSAPVPDKTVGIPKEEWDGEDSNFYPWIADRCWNGQEDEIDCWKTTLLTPINLKCVDPDPHPVDHETVCFQVELDAEDATQDYCDYYSGTVGDDGFCCLDYVIEEFYFNEVSEHNLAYYCVDALGNTGPTDEEKFKIEETAFEIQLNRKWNLISVPVKLLDDSMDKVFKDVNDTVKTVWTYDPTLTICGQNWCIYTPDGNAVNDDLTTMLPGWGYWVLSNEDDLLVIGGSLFSPAMTPPSKAIVAGWNLIGYYGAEDAPEGLNGYPGYYGPDGNGKEAYCALYSLGESFLDKGWAYLATYWEPYNPDLWVELDMYDNMDPGAGYWILALEDGIYGPTSTCDG